MRHKKRWWYVLITAVMPLIIWMGIIFYFSSRQKLPFTQDYTTSFIIFKSFHLIEYGVLFMLWVRFFMLVGMQKPLLSAFVLTVFYGASDELHQTLTPTREGLPRDILVDALGALIAWFALVRYSFLKKTISQ